LFRNVSKFQPPLDLWEVSMICRWLVICHHNLMFYFLPSILLMLFTYLLSSLPPLVCDCHNDWNLSLRIVKGTRKKPTVCPVSPWCWVLLPVGNPVRLAPQHLLEVHMITNPRLTETNLLESTDSKRWSLVCIHGVCPLSLFADGLDFTLHVHFWRRNHPCLSVFQVTATWPDLPVWSCKSLNLLLVVPSFPH
jgi:hypothetical protein